MDTSAAAVDYGCKVSRKHGAIQYMGTAVGTLLIASSLVVALNALVPEVDAGLWIYHSAKFNQLESLLYSSAVGVPPAGQMSYPRLLWNQLKLDPCRTIRRWSEARGGEKMDVRISCFPSGDPKLVMITLADNKVYVGFVSQLPPVVATSFSYLRILPVWSGYRDADRRVYRTTSYEKAILSSGDRDLLIKVVPTKDIVAAGVFVDGTFPIHDIPKAKGNATTRPVRRRKTVRKRAKPAPR